MKYEGDEKESGLEYNPDGIMKTGFYDERNTREYRLTDTRCF